MSNHSNKYILLVLPHP